MWKNKTEEEYRRSFCTLKMQNIHSKLVVYKETALFQVKRSQCSLCFDGDLS